MSHARHRDLNLPGTTVTETLLPPGGRIIQEPGGEVTTLRGPPDEELTRDHNGIWTLHERALTPDAYARNWQETTQGTLPPMRGPGQDYQLRPSSRYADQTYLTTQSGTSGMYPPQINRPQQQQFQFNSGAYSASQGTLPPMRGPEQDYQLRPSSPYVDQIYPPTQSGVSEMYPPHIYRPQQRPFQSNSSAHSGAPPPTAGSSAAYQPRPTTSRHLTTPSDVYACRLCKSFHERGVNVKCEISKNLTEQSVNGTPCCHTCYAQSKNGLDDYKGCNPAGRKYNKKGGKSKGVIEIGTYETG